jgi:hypothetical protein
LQFARCEITLKITLSVTLVIANSAASRNRNNASMESIGSLGCGRGTRSVCFRNLSEEIDELLDGSHEITTGHVVITEQMIKIVSCSPCVGESEETCVGGPRNGKPESNFIACD